MDRKVRFFLSSVSVLTLWIASPAQAFWVRQLIDDPGRFTLLGIIVLLALVSMGVFILKLSNFLDILLGEPKTIHEKRLSDGVHATSHIIITILWWWAILSYGDKLPDHFAVLIPVIIFSLYSVTMLLIPGVSGLFQAITGNGYRIISKDGKPIVEGWK